MKTQTMLHLDVGDSAGTKVNGSYDLIVDGAVDDVKSASDWSYVTSLNPLTHLQRVIALVM